jgi:hypothetical protein
MKKNFLKFMFFAAFAAVASFSFISCKPEEVIEEEIVLDGFYISGEACAFTTVTKLGQMKATPVESDNNSARVGLNEIYIALEANKNFTITEVAGATKTVYGPGVGFASVDQVAANDEMGAKIQKGKFAAGGTFKVPTSGLYHVVVDKQTMNIVIMPVLKWAIIGGATPLGWSDNDMALKGAFSKDSMVFEIKDLTLLAGDFKFRHSGAWKQTIVAEPVIKVNTNFGGTMAALVPGGANIPLVKADNGKYTVTARWTKEKGMLITMLKTGTVVVAEYPANLYMIGSSIGGWDWTGAYIITMNPVHSHPNAFWAIAYIDAPATEPGFKFAPGKEWKGDFGKTGTATNGVYGKGGDNLTVATAGYYMVYVDLKAEKISVTDPEIYLIGAAIGNVWDYALAAGKFTVDNTAKKITSPAFTGAGELRMYATCPLSQLDTPKADWWQTEFMVLNSKIEYRGIGGDQARVSVLAGKKAVLDFKANTGVIQ